MSRTRKEFILTGKGSEVYRLMVRGWTPSEISASLGVPYSSVTWMLREAQRITDGQIERLNKEGVLRELYQHHRERKRTLWMLYTTAKLEVVKVSCLKQLADEDERFEALAERLSLIDPRTAFKTEHDINITERKDLRIRIDVRYSDIQLADRVPDFVGRLRRPGALDCAAPA